MCAWYNTPVAPYDPINKEQEPNQAIRYLRDNFAQSGQDSNTLPPAQDPASWQQLTNVMPITQASLLKRWGYQLFFEQNTTSPATRMYSFQNNNTLQRQLVYSSSDNVAASDETGVQTISSVFTPSTVGGLNSPRMVDSRNYAYFYDGVASDLFKWDGTVDTGNVTNWGVAAPSPSTIATSSGPVGGGGETTSGTGSTWTNPAAVLINDTTYATAHVSSGTSYFTKFINVTGFGFAIPGGATITGIKASVIGHVSASSAQSINVKGTLLKSGVAYGVSRNSPLVSTTDVTVSLNSSTSDLWNGDWTAADINDVNFGIQFSAQAGIATVPGVNFFITFIEIQVFYTTATSAILVANGAAGAITLTVGRVYYCIYQNSLTGHLSDLNQPSFSTGPITNLKLDITNIPVSTDAQVDSKVLLATADGGDPSILYFVASLPNAATTYTDNTDEITLNNNQLYLYTDPFGNEFGVTFNDPPPNGTVCIKHKGRLWMAQQQNLFFSKAVSELTLPSGFIAGKYEEAWPPSNYFDISGGAETINGLLSDGTVIYIGTQSHIRRIFGDNPDNFQQPEICHQDVGVLNQEVWETVFLQGTPTGFMWLSPDFKVMGSDGNTYMDLGHKIQDVLNSINPAAAQSAHAMFVQQGPFDLYILAIPTGSNTLCDTHCVFNMRDQQWTIWKPSDPSAGMLFNLTAAGTPQWLFSAVYPGPGAFSSEAVYQYVPTATQDRVGSANPNALPANFTTSATTPWLHLGSPTVRKVLDELEIVGSPTMLVTVNGSQTQANFASPVAIVSNAPLTVGPFSTYKVFLSAKTSKYKYYQLVFTTTDTTTDFVDSFCIRAIPWNTL